MKKTLQKIRDEKKHTRALMKSFLLNHKGTKYKANTLLGLLWNYVKGKKG